MLDLYKILGVPNDATSDQIRSATETIRLVLSDKGDTCDLAELQREMSSLTQVQGGGSLHKSNGVLNDLIQIEEPIWMQLCPKFGGMPI